MEFKTYDIVKINKEFVLNIDSKERLFPSNIEGVIVESYNDDFLIEFKHKDVIDYVLIKKDDLSIVWRDNNTDNDLT